MKAIANDVLPILHITNYQKYITPDVLTQSVYDNMPDDENLPERIYASIAYMKIVRKPTLYVTTLVLSIKGKSYKFYHRTKEDYFFNAYYNLEIDIKQRGQSEIDASARIFQDAFSAVVNKNIKQIVKAITCAYANR